MSKYDALTDLRVVENCPVNWNSMRGDDQVRYCSKCLRSVYNISNMDRESAAELIEKSEGRVCVRYYRRPDGMIMTSDCSTRVKARVKLMAILAPIASVFGIAFFPVLAQGAVASPMTAARSNEKKIESLTAVLKDTSDPEERKELVAERDRDYQAMRDELKRAIK